MGAICNLCEKDMLKAAGCIPTFFMVNGKRYDRRKYSGGWDPGTGRCGDCGCKVGHYHHMGCDVERCPICGGQLLGCDCMERKDVQEMQYVKAKVNA